MNYDLSMAKRTYVQTQRAEQAEAKRRQILRAARELLLTTSLPEITLDAVATAAGAARSTVYLAVGNRAGLFEALAHQLLVDVGFDQLVAAIEEPDPVVALRASFSEAARLYAADRAVARALWSWGELEPDAAEAFAVLEHGRWEGLQHLARRLRTAGVLRPGLSIEAAAETLWVLTSFDSFDQLFTGRGMAATKVAQRLTAMAEAVLLDGSAAGAR
jgi:AcrR family transcriptional regulator